MADTPATGTGGMGPTEGKVNWGVTIGAVLIALPGFLQAIGMTGKAQPVQPQPPAAVTSKWEDDTTATLKRIADRLDALSVKKTVQVP